MKKITLRLFLCASFLVMSHHSHSQERTCGMEEYMQEMLQDPSYAKEYDKNQDLFKARLQELLSQEDFSERGGSTITIPVAVHFPSANEADRDCLVALAQSQLDILNEDYSATNADISQWTTASSNYPGVVPGVANIAFCFALSNHPVGLDPELIEGNPAVTIGYDFGGGNNVDANWSGYMNFVVRPLSGGTLGFSPLGGSIAAGQAVTMNTFAFGSGAGCSGSGIVPGAPFNLGRTVTHELGHFYNLNHTWGSGGCSSDDGITDTPNITGPTYSCPAPGSVPACVPGQFSMTMNYMDYVNDACMYLFSAGQSTVMDAYVSGVLQSQLKPNVCTPAVPGFNLVAVNDEILSCPTTDNEVVFNFDYNTIMSFSETTNFTASGAPAGATISFSPTSLNDTGNFTMTVGSLGATAEGEYTITVTGTSSPGSVVETVDVLLKNTCTEIVCDSFDSPQNLSLPIVDGSGGNPGQPFATNVINVPDSGTIESLTVNVDVTHTFVSDLLVRIIHPDGVTFVDVWSGDCGSNDNFDVTFDDNGATLVCASPTVGTFVPDEALSLFNGLDAQGDWTILLADFFAQDTGNLNDWSLTICTEQVLSTDELSLDKLTIFPNPNNGEFNIGFDSNSGEDILIEVFDLRGRTIYSKRHNSVTRFEEVIDLNNAQSGVYLLNISDGPQRVTKKIIIE